jgi:predicted nucleic acid-binding protein
MTAIAEAAQRAGGSLIVPTVVIAEATTGVGSRDAKVNRVIKRAVIVPCDEPIARRAAQLRHGAQMERPQAIDAVVVATAEASLGKTVVTSDPDDLRPLAAPANSVRVKDFREIPTQ